MIYIKLSSNTASYLESCSHKPVILNEANKAKLRHAAKQSAIYGVAGISALCGLSLMVVVAINGVQDFFKENELVFKSPVEVSVWTNRVLTVNKIERKTILVENTKSKDEAIAKSENPTLAQKICSKDWNCELALAISKGEGYYHGVDGWSLNTNGSIDVGYFRINSTHFNEAGCSLAEVSTEDGNINCAYTIWDRADGLLGNGIGAWSDWVAFTTGSYRAHL